MLTHGVSDGVCGCSTSKSRLATSKFEVNVRRKIRFEIARFRTRLNGMTVRGKDGAEW